MKVLITSTGNDLDAQVDLRFGRARYFILYDTEDKSFSAIDNTQNLSAPQGAGVQSGQNVVNTGAEALITGNCGPKAFRVLTEAGVQIYIGASGTVREAIADLENGKLSLADDANVQGHWI